MDDTLKVEFPLGDGTVVVRRPGPKQMFALSVLRRPGTDPVATHQYVTHIVSFLEKLTGPEQWASVVGRMMAEEVGPEELVQLIGDIVAFDWNAHAATTPEPDPEPEPAVPARPAPRVVSGG